MKLVERHPCFLILLPVLACWPVWQWMAQRALDRSDDPWELLGLATAAVFVWQTGSLRKVDGKRLILPLVLISLYAGTYHLLPPLLRAVLAMSALASALSATCFEKRLHWPLWGLLLLSLPLIASLNFYLGYPLRVITGSASAALLQMNGFAVTREGAMLAWNGSMIAVDAPCSGIKMLWTGCYLCCTLAAFQGLNTVQMLSLCCLGLIVVLAANILRASALFYMEARIIALPEVWHAGIGVAIFVLTTITLTLLAQALSQKQNAT